jgi:ubiquinone/menaquinone biosynthesis C-methylase UbiE
LPAQHDDPDLSRFSSVDSAGKPEALIAWLDTAKVLPAIRAAKDALIGQLGLQQARHVLDVGCGLGTDVAELAQRLPPGGTATGIDASDTMIDEARRRTAHLGRSIVFDIGDAASLPYDDASFDACRTETVLNHVPDPQQVIREMARVTRPGGRIAALEFDHGTTLVDHPDRETTRTILRTFSDSMAQGWIGRQLPRLFRQAGLTSLQVTPTVVLTGYEVFQVLIGNHVRRLCDDGVLTQQQAAQWWSPLEQQAISGDVLAGATLILVVASKS